MEDERLQYRNNFQQLDGEALLVLGRRRLFILN